VVERLESDSPADLARLARGEGHVAWYDRRLEPWLREPAAWPELLRHPLEVLHLGALERTDLAVGDLGRVDFDSPFLMPGPGDRHPSWLVGPAAGIASAALVRALGIGPGPGLARAILEFGRRAHREGLFLYAEPALLGGRVPDEVSRALRFELARRDLAVLIARGYGRRWLAFWALAAALFDRSLPLGAALAGWRAPAPPDTDRDSLARLHPQVDPGIASEEEVDAVIPTLGRPGPLRDLLADLAAQTVPPRRVIVVDQRPPGAGLPPPADLGADWPFELVSRTVDWIGACRARNLALGEVRSPWVLFLDDDVRLPADTVARLAATARAYGVGAVNAAVYLPRQEAETGTDALPRVWSTFGTCVALVETAALRQAGPFDERLEGGYGEDAEIGIRLRRAGCNVLYAPAIRVLHLKAPMGGFRYDFPFPWRDEVPPPQPSPIFLYARNKHATPSMRQGYRLFYLLNRLRSAPALAWPAELFRALRRWRRSAHWAERLSEGAS
jgi:glycosyltransferase involved in cell wall biosynthesis